jgi:hypothetical protein
MTEMDKLIELNFLRLSFLKKINQLSLQQWIDLAAELNVAKNDREGAASKLAKQELKKRGTL